MNRSGKTSRRDFIKLTTATTLAAATSTTILASEQPLRPARISPADKIRLGEISLVINTPLGRASHYDEQAIRRAALQFNVPCVTTMTGAQAVVEAIASRKESETFQVYSLQELHAAAQTVG